MVDSLQPALIYFRFTFSLATTVLHSNPVIRPMEANPLPFRGVAILGRERPLLGKHGPVKSTNEHHPAKNFFRSVLNPGTLLLRFPYHNQFSCRHQQIQPFGRLAVKLTAGMAYRQIDSVHK
jgi:hypothetical protein